jgi:hypothetical protein
MVCKPYHAVKGTETKLAYIKQASFLNLPLDYRGSKVTDHFIDSQSVNL